jgi:uncharacterized protein YbjT (DUF2867 family)
MNLLILGATGGTGRALVEQALEQGATNASKEVLVTD